MKHALTALALTAVLLAGAAAPVAAQRGAAAAVESEDGEPPDSEESLALEFSLSGTLQRDYAMLDGQRPPKAFYDTTQAVLDYRLDNFSLFVDWAMIDDERYDPSEVYMLGRYLYINDAHVAYEGERFALKTGRSVQEDVVDTPYSLFVSSEPVPAIQAEARYTGDRFFYSTRWVRLNHRSEQTYFGSGDDPGGLRWVDRGANFHVYGLQFGEWRFGLQESAVYLDDSFNAEFFVSPMIMYFTQLVIDEGAKPWQENANSKHLIGFFVDRTKQDGYFASQILIDDINGDILPGVDNRNQNRLAWTVGGYRDFDFGRLGLYHGGATKDTFGPTYTADRGQSDDEYEPGELPLYYSTNPYPYTYYPAVQYPLDDGTPMPIDYRDNYIGYKYGENTLSFLLDYENAFATGTEQEVSLYAALEWVMNGAKSPANPWHEYDHWSEIGPATRLLDDTVEHILTVRGAVERPIELFGVPFSVFADAEVGVAFNAMALEPATEARAATEPWIYRPQKGEHEPLMNLTLGVRYRWDLLKRQP